MIVFIIITNMNLLRFSFPPLQRSVSPRNIRNSNLHWSTVILRAKTNNIGQRSSYTDYPTEKTEQLCEKHLF